MSATCFVLLIMHLSTQQRTNIDKTKWNLNNRPNRRNHFDVQNFATQVVNGQRNP
jgi:hypothetical protein